MTEEIVKLAYHNLIQNIFKYNEMLGALRNCEKVFAEMILQRIRDKYDINYHKVYTIDGKDYLLHKMESYSTIEYDLGDNDDDEILTISIEFSRTNLTDSQKIIRAEEYKKHDFNENTYNSTFMLKVAFSFSFDDCINLPELNFESISNKEN